MFYKIMKNNRVIDVCDGLFYVKYLSKTKIMLPCSIWEAQAIASSDGREFWREKTLLPLEAEGYDEVEAIPIDEYEYRQLKALNGKTPEEIIDEFVLSLISEGVI